MHDKFKYLLASGLTSCFLIYSVNLYRNLPFYNNNYHNDADNGKLIWQKYNCIACHQIYGLGGYLGPDLTNVYSLKGPEYITAFVRSGTVVMPRFMLSENEMNDMLAFLKVVDLSGSADPRTFTLNNDGTITQK